nr:DNA translocase FtsK [Spirochaeta isovalerica]
MDLKKLSYIFYGIGALLTLSLLLAVGGLGSFLAAPGRFLFESFSFPAFYLPFFMILYGYLSFKDKLDSLSLIVLTLSVIPFLTVSLFFRIWLTAEGSYFINKMLESMGKGRSLFLLGSLSALEIFLIIILPRYFSDISSETEELYEPEEKSFGKEENGEEEAFKEYAFRFPEPDEADFRPDNEQTESIDDIFTSILSGGPGAVSSEPVPPPRPGNIEPVKDEDLYDDLESPFIESDPAFDVLSREHDEADLADELTGQGDYTYHKHSDTAAQNEAAEKMSEIIAELDNVLAAAEGMDERPVRTFDTDRIRNSGEKADKKEDEYSDARDEPSGDSGYYGYDETDIANEDLPDKAADQFSDEYAQDSDYSDAGYLEDRLDELDDYRDISDKLAPVEGDEGGVLREVVKPRQPYMDDYSVPVEGVLAEYPDDKYQEIDEETRKAARVLEVTLEEFKISAKVTGIKKGPVITMFELLPAPGVKISRITNLADNIALRLAASRVRIVAPIPGKHAVGIEVPNKKRAIVSFSEMVTAPEMKDQDVAVPIVLGKDIRGGVQVIDLTRTPHLLIAGATGSGKSVCVNSLICSILYERSPADVKLIMVDPKIVELKLYNDIPHLLTPVITDPKKAIQAIQWCLYEMERRYALLDSVGVREIRSYNKRIKERKLATTELPYLILVIDEFADLMATSGKELEAMIARLAAMSRAVGIHLVLATQRPSADVITGLIKANFPSRIAFMVASMMDSRIIIDSAGAEKLLGKGDMLFTSAWDPFPSRVQGAFMSEEEVERVVEYVKTLGAPEYIDDEIFIDDDESDEPSLAGGGSVDPLFNKALEIVSSAGKASASYLQRRLKIGYNRAARLVEQMEEMGIVGPQNGSKPREVIHSHMPDSSNY